MCRNDERAINILDEYYCIVDYLEEHIVRCLLGAMIDNHHNVTGTT